MNIHTFYKCEKCNEFHSTDFSVFIKKWTQYQAEKHERRKELPGIQALGIPFSPADMIRRYSNARNIREVRAVDRPYDAQRSHILSGENRICRTSYPGVREAAMVGRFKFEFFLCVCKAIGTGEKICVAELENRAGFHYSPTAPTADTPMMAVLKI